ncbi:MAG: hypothetical protein RI949_1222 [Pseudomonadota bacterium]
MLAGLLCWPVVVWGSPNPGATSPAATSAQQALIEPSPVSLSFQDIDVRTALQILADHAGLNLVVTDAVKGAMSLRLQSVSWKDALDLILHIKGLSARQTGSILWVCTADEWQHRERMAAEAHKRQTEAEPLQFRSFQLRYARAEELSRSLVGQTSSGSTQSTWAVAGSSALGSSALALGGSARALTSRGSVIFDARTNQLFVTDVASRLDEVQRLIERIDVPVRQVLIEARIVEADDTFGRALGVKLGLNALPGGNSVSTGPLLGVDLPASTGPLGGVNAATSAFSLLGAAASRWLSVELSALEAQGKGRIVAHPRLITTDQKKALIEQGEELPYQAATSSGATNVQFRKANLKLEVIPMITPEGHVMLEVDVNKDSVGRSTVAGFAIDTKHIRTEVLVENGGTVVIGGIYTQSEKDGANQVPLLADMPLIGPLFQNRQRNVSKTELLVFLTPRVLTSPGGTGP